MDSGKKRKNRKRNRPVENIEPQPGSSSTSNRGKVPPVFLRDKSKWSIVKKDLESEGVLVYRNVLLQNGLKIMVNDYENYFKLISYLEKKKFEMHSFALPEEKTKKFVLMGIPDTIPPEDIMQDLKNAGYEPLKVQPMTSRITKKRLPMFMVDFHKKDDRARFISKCLGISIVTCEFKKEKGPTQCYNCQGFFHVQSRCVGVARCPKCAGQHKAADCKRPKSEKPTCVNCRGDHTANYRGCPKIPKMLPKKKPVINKQKTEPSVFTGTGVYNPNEHTQPTTLHNRFTGEGIVTPELVTELMRHTNLNLQFNFLTI